MHYVTVFDASQDVFRHWGVVAGGGVMTLVGAVLLFLPNRVLVAFSRGTGPIFTRLFASVFFLFSLCWTISSGKYFYESDGAASVHAKRRECTMVEGRVENFHPMSAEGHDSESFDVAGQHFSYSDFALSPGFNNSSSRGGPIRAGLPVRICHRGNLILILEIAR